MNIYHMVLLPVGCALALFLTYRAAAVVAEGRRNLKPGYLTSLPTRTSRKLRKYIGRLLCWLFVGRLYVEGASNLGFYGRIVALGGHQTERDALIMLRLMDDRPLRYFIAVNQVQGWRVPLVAYTGGIVVHPGVMQSALALRAAIRAMRNEPDCNFVAFPQGKLVRDNNLVREDFRAGVVVLVAKTAETSELPVAYLPFAIYLDRDPAHADAFHRFVNKMGWRSFRRFFDDITYGAVIVLGHPVTAGVAPSDRDEAMDGLFDQIKVLAARAEAIGKSGQY